MKLREDQIERYSRQILLPNVGGKGQEKIYEAWNSRLKGVEEEKTLYKMGD